MIVMRPYLKMWYDYLKEGKIMGMKCKSCGEISFPPVPVCGKCSSTDVEWCTMSGEATITCISNSPMGIAPYFEDQVMCAIAEVKEGMNFSSWIPDFDEDDEELLRSKLPLPVKMSAYKLDEDISFPVFNLIAPLDAKQIEPSEEKEIQTETKPAGEEDSFIEMLEKIYPQKRGTITMQTEFVKGLNTTSMTTFMLIAELEERLGRRVSYAKVKRCITVHDAYKLYKSLQK